MLRKCKTCKYSYCGDLSDVSGFNCRKFKTFKIINLDIIHPFCLDGFKFSFLNILYWWSING